MSVDLATLSALTNPIKHGDDPRTEAQLERFLTRRLNFYVPMIDRLTLQVEDPDAYAAVTAHMAQIRVDARAANTFNHQLADLRAAKARLARYRLADGRPEKREEQPTGEIDPDTGEALTESVVVQTAIDPLPATVEAPVLGDDGLPTGATEQVPNPAIVEDDAERAAAQAVIDGTPQDVLDFDAA